MTNGNGEAKGKGEGTSGLGLTAEELARLQAFAEALGLAKTEGAVGEITPREKVASFISRHLGEFDDDVRIAVNNKIGSLFQGIDPTDTAAVDLADRLLNNFGSELRAIAAEKAVGVEADRKTKREKRFRDTLDILLFDQLDFVLPTLSPTGAAILKVMRDNLEKAKPVLEAAFEEHWQRIAVTRDRNVADTLAQTNFLGSNFGDIVNLMVPPGSVLAESSVSTDVTSSMRRAVAQAATLAEQHAQEVERLGAEIDALGNRLANMDVSGLTDAAKKQHTSLKNALKDSRKDLVERFQRLVGTGITAQQFLDVELPTALSFGLLGSPIASGVTPGSATGSVQGVLDAIQQGAEAEQAAEAEAAEAEQAAEAEAKGRKTFAENLRTLTDAFNATRDFDFQRAVELIQADPNANVASILVQLRRERAEQVTKETEERLGQFGPQIAAGAAGVFAEGETVAPELRQQATDVGQLVGRRLAPLFATRPEAPGTIAPVTSQQIINALTGIEGLETSPFSEQETAGIRSGLDPNVFRPPMTIFQRQHLMDTNPELLAAMEEFTRTGQTADPAVIASIGRNLAMGISGGRRAAFESFQTAQAAGVAASQKALVESQRQQEQARRRQLPVANVTRPR